MCREMGSKFRNLLRTTFVHVSLSRRRRNLYLLDLRDDRNVRSALFFFKKSSAQARVGYTDVTPSTVRQYVSNRCIHVISRTSLLCS